MSGWKSPSKAALKEILAAGKVMGENEPEPLDTPEPQFHESAQTLEEVVRELLRPMLQSWLDKNQRSLIEREVQAKIAREARTAGLENSSGCLSGLATDAKRPDGLRYPLLPSAIWTRPARRILTR
jgi:hypothetical protein